MPRDEQLWAINRDRDTVLADKLVRARSIVARTRGLMGVPSLPTGGGIYLDGDNAIHTCFMRFPIDVAFVDRDARVLHVVFGMVPWRISRIVWRARGILELPPGTLERTQTRVGDRLWLETRRF
jgi:uncharacterized membrane protein (UPF0127 family)